MLIIGVGVAAYGWAVVASLCKHERAEAVIWLVSGLLLGVFAALDHLGLSRWLSGIVLFASMTLGFMAGWRGHVRRRRVRDVPL
jgi:hypothetical protein